jgi:hypothetical protein
MKIEDKVIDECIKYNAKYSLNGRCTIYIIAKDRCKYLEKVEAHDLFIEKEFPHLLYICKYKIKYKFIK